MEPQGLPEAADSLSWEGGGEPQPRRRLLVGWSAARENLRTRTPVLRLVCVSIALTEAVRSRYVTLNVYILTCTRKPSFETVHSCTQVHTPRQRTSNARVSACYLLLVLPHPFPKDR